MDNTKVQKKQMDYYWYKPPWIDAISVKVILFSKIEQITFFLVANGKVKVTMTTTYVFIIIEIRKKNSILNENGMSGCFDWGAF